MTAFEDDKYKTRHWKYGGMRKGYKFQVCPHCHKRGVRAKVSRGKNGKVIAHKICKYCSWFQVK